METLSYYQNPGGRVFRHVGFDENEDYLFEMLFEEGRPFAVRKVDVKKDWKHVPDFDPSTLKRMTCGRRLSEFGPWKQTENVDWWEERDGHPTCSFCGSASFEFFVEILDKINAGEKGYTIQRAKSYKFYLDTPDKTHIKFYTPHIPDNMFNEDGKLIGEIQEKLTDAILESNHIFEERYRAKFPRHSSEAKRENSSEG